MRRHKKLNVSGYIEEIGTRYEFFIHSEQIVNITKPWSFTVSDERQTTISLDMPFLLIVDGVSEKIHSADRYSALNYIQYSKLVRMTVRRTGYLEMEFDNGVKIMAPADDAEFQYEAWHIYNNQGFHMFTPIGGCVCLFVSNMLLS